MFTQYIITEKFKNTVQVDSGRAGVLRPDGTTFTYDANTNVVAVLQFPNDDNPDDVHTYYTQGDNLDNIAIDNFARDKIASLNAQAAAFDALQIGQPLLPTPVDPKLDTLRQKQVAFQKASIQAMVNFRNDPAEKQAYADLVDAQTAVATADAVVGGALKA